MKVGFLIPPSPQNRKIVRAIDCSFETKANYLWQPNDFMIISSLLRPGDEIFFVDGTADSLSESEFLHNVRQINSPDLLFFAFSSIYYGSDYQYFTKIREFFPEPPVFVIGDLFIEKKSREAFLDRCDGIVFQPYQLELGKMAAIGKNPGESLKGVCRKPEDELFPAKENIRKNHSGSFPRHEVFQKRGYVFPFARHFRFATVTVAWGCPYNCSYCTDSNFTPYVRDPKDVIRELTYLKNLGIEELFFADKAFGFPHETLTVLLEEMATNFSFSWSCYHHPNLYKPEFLELMKRAGCHTIIVGIDSYNVESLKLYNRAVTREKIESLLFHANKLEIDVCADFILGLDHETREDVLRTIDYSLRLPIDFASFNIASPLPGSSIREQAVQAGKMASADDSFDTLGDKKILGSRNIDAADLRKLRRKAVIAFYLRFSYILRRVRRIDSLEHLMVQFLEALSMFKKMKVKTNWG